MNGFWAFRGVFPLGVGDVRNNLQQLANGRCVLVGQLLEFKFADREPFATGNEFVEFDPVARPTTRMVLAVPPPGIVPTTAVARVPIQEDIAFRIRCPNPTVAVADKSTHSTPACSELEDVPGISLQPRQSPNATINFVVSVVPRLHRFARADFSTSERSTVY